MLVCLCVCTLTHISLLQDLDHCGPIKKRPHCPLLHFYRYQSSVSLISIYVVIKRAESLWKEGDREKAEFRNPLSVEADAAGKI